MSSNMFAMDQIKRSLRKLKKLEAKIRFGNFRHTSGLVWDEFFDLGKNKGGGTRYSLDSLASMSNDEYQSVISEYFLYVYYRLYKENGIVDMPIYDPDILIQMGLPGDADSYTIKKKFRELAKKYHPDTGGDGRKFIELMENYKKLTE